MRLCWLLSVSESAANNLSFFALWKISLARISALYHVPVARCEGIEPHGTTGDTVVIPDFEHLTARLFTNHEIQRLNPNRNTVLHLGEYFQLCNRRVACVCSWHCMDCQSNAWRMERLTRETLL